MAIASNVPSFIEKIEHLESMIENADNGISTNYLISKEDYASGFPVGETESIFDERFTMLIDSWGTSTRKVGA